MPKFIRVRKDGYIFPYNDEAAKNEIDYEVIEEDEPPHAAKFLSPEERVAAEEEAAAAQAAKERVRAEREAKKSAEAGKAAAAQ